MSVNAIPATTSEVMNGNAAPHFPLEKTRLVVLTGQGPLPWIMINTLLKEYPDLVVLEETPESGRKLLERRVKMLGLLPVLGQIPFLVLNKFMHKWSAGRKAEICAEYNMDVNRNAAAKTLHIGSVNAETCRAALQKLNPDVVFVVGTRIIRKKTLSCVNAPFINYHAGINPAYRGVNGGYWALASNDAAHAGITVHLVDEGVDTGSVIAQATFTPTRKDNFISYFYLQAAVGRAPVLQAIRDALAGKLVTKAVDLPSKQWFHPNLLQYLWIGITRKVW